MLFIIYIAHNKSLLQNAQVRTRQWTRRRRRRRPLAARTAECPQAHATNAISHVLSFSLSICVFMYSPCTMVHSRPMFFQATCQRLFYHSIHARKQYAGRELCRVAGVCGSSMRHRVTQNQCGINIGR